MSLWKKLFGSKEPEKPAPKPRYKVTLMFFDCTNNKTTKVVVPNATDHHLFWYESKDVMLHKIWIEDNVQVYVESERQALTQVNVERVNA